MVRHQAVRNDANGKALGMRAKQLKIRGVVATTKEHALAAITSLSDVMGYVGEDNTRVSWHACTLSLNLAH